MATFYSTNALYTGKEWIFEVAVEVKNGKIVSIQKEGFDQQKAFPYMVPALIDLQIYGAAEKLLSEFPAADCIEEIYEYCLKGGTAFFQPTIASQTNEIIYKAIDAVKSYKTNGGKGCIGLHIEGPWINQVKKGAHHEKVIHTPSMQEVKDLLEYGKDWISMITLAPEICSKEIIDLIQSNGIVVSAGHSNASYEMATQFFNDSIQVATHLYNAMSGLQHREPGMVGALFNHKKAMCSIIADGYHVNYHAIEIAKKIMGDRLFCITDAVTTTSTGWYQHILNGDKYESQGTLSGSALTLIKSIHNLMNNTSIDFEEAINMCSVYPAKLMKRTEMSALIDIQENANLLCLDENKQLMNLIVNNTL
jgi:N-acetylglucosamine-6-phosphate deacetylase